MVKHKDIKVTNESIRVRKQESLLKYFLISPSEWCLLLFILLGYIENADLMKDQTVIRIPLKYKNCVSKE